MHGARRGREPGARRRREAGGGPGPRGASCPRQPPPAPAPRPGSAEPRKPGAGRGRLRCGHALAPRPARPRPAPGPPPAPRPHSPGARAHFPGHPLAPPCPPAARPSLVDCGSGRPAPSRTLPRCVRGLRLPFPAPPPTQSPVPLSLPPSWPLGPVSLGLIFCFPSSLSTPTPVSTSLCLPVSVSPLLPSPPVSLSPYFFPLILSLPSLFFCPSLSVAPSPPAPSNPLSLGLPSPPSLSFPLLCLSAFLVHSPSLRLTLSLSPLTPFCRALSRPGHPQGQLGRGHHPLSPRDLSPQTPAP